MAAGVVPFSSNGAEHDWRAHSAAEWLRLARGETMRGTGGAESDMSRYGRAAQAAAQAAGDTEAEAMALHYVWHRPAIAAAADEGDRLINAALQRCRELKSARGAQLLQTTRVHWMYLQCHFVEAIQLGERVLRETADLPAAARVQLKQHVALSHKMVGNVDRFLDLCRRSLPLADLCGSRYVQASCRINLANCLSTTAFDPEAALPLLEQAHALLLPDPLARGWLSTLNNRIQTLDMLGRHEEAYQAAVTDLARPGLDALPPLHPAFVVCALIGVGRLDEAEARLGDESTEGHPVWRTMNQQAYREAKARLLRAQGRHAQAREYVQWCLDQVDPISREPWYEARLYDHLRGASAALGDMRGALDAAIAARRACLSVVKLSARARYLVGQVESGLSGSEALRPIDLRRLEAMERAAQERHDADMADIEALQRGAEPAAAAPRPRQVPPFLAHVVHELRNPIGGMLGMADLLMRSELDTRQRRFVELMRSSADTLLLLVNDVLDLAKLESGRFEFRPAPVDFAAWLQAVVAPFAVQASAKGLALGTVLAPGVPARLVFDELRLGQVLANLLSNALKFTGEGRIDVSVRGTAGGAEGCRLHVEVRDTGPGISAENQAKLFREFAQADAGIAKSHGGTGLGLALCKQLVERMGGRVGMDSTLGVGSCFWFELVLPVAAGSALPA